MGGDRPNSNSSAVAESVENNQDDDRRESLTSDYNNNNNLQPSESKNTQLFEDLNDDNANTVAEASSSTPGIAHETLINPELSTQQQQHDWHTEMLCGMFLRSDEKELECLEHEVAASHNNKPSGSDDTQHPIYQPPTKTGEHDVGIGKNSEDEDTNITSNNEQATQQQKQLDKFLTDMLKLGQTMDSTVLSLIPEALRGLPQSQSLQQKQQSSNNNIKSNDMNNDQTHNLEGSETSNEGDSDHCNFNNPLILPPSWKRSDYASRTLPELERHIISLLKRGIRRGAGIFNGTERNSLTNGKNGLHHPSPSKPEPKTYELFTILYNECSLSAMANWAMLDYSPRSNNRSVNHDEGNKQKWERCKEKHEKHRVTNRTQHGVIIPAPMFHLCGVCGGFGHYEVECESLLPDGDGKKRKREYNAATESSNKPGSQKKKRMHEAVLDEEEKSSIISSLAKEIHIQRMQNQNYLTERKAAYAKNPFNSSGSFTNTTTNGDSSVSAALFNTSHTPNNKTDTATETQYTGKSTCCKICLTSVDDGQMLLCDGCDELFHCQCLDPPLDSIPEGDWFCEICSSHDNDASSVVEIEGCGGFVIEQRKQSVAEEESMLGSSGINLGPTKNFWTSAITLLPEQDPIVEDELYLQKHLGRENGHTSEDFFVGETCWAKRFDHHLGRVVWWPGMVSDVETRTLRRLNCVKTTYTVLFFALDEESDIHETEMLPFFPYYEDIGHKRLMRCDNLIGHETFRRALMLCVSTLGLKSLNQALKLARNGIQMAAVMNNEYRCLLPPGWKMPVGWENAEIDNIDGIVILAKTGGEQTSTDTASPGNRAPSEVDQQLTDNATDDSRSHRMVSQFSVDELIGGIVSWQSDDLVVPETNNAEELEIQYGIVVSLDTETEMALVRTTSMLCGNLDELFHNVSTNDLVIHASDLGATTWIPLKHIRFVASKPSLSDLGKFKRKLKSNMRHEMESFHKQTKRDARFRETCTLELQDVLEERQY